MVGYRGEDEVCFNLPAMLTALVEIAEGDWRTSTHEITVTLDIQGEDDGPYRPAVEALQIKRAGKTAVTAAALHGIRLPELRDFMMTHPPCCEKPDAKTFQDLDLPAKDPAVQKVLSPARRSGKRGVGVVDLARLAEVVKSVEGRTLQKTIMEAFPGVGKRTLQRAKAQAIKEGLLP